MKTIIAGGRDFANPEFANSEYVEMDTKFFWESMSTIDFDITQFISGGAKGADLLGEKYYGFYKLWNNESVTFKRFLPNYDLYGKIAPLKRNEEMANYADVLIAFWDGRSTGTLDMINKARKAGLRVITFYYDALRVAA